MRTTSIEAYREKILSLTIVNDYSHIYWCLNWHDKGMTYTEIARDLNWSNPNKVSRRTKEMVEMGLIKECEVRVCKIAGSKCLTYMVCK
jgi:DNA-binding transcriptional regulator GbsR (MarR family)